MATKSTRIRSSDYQALLRLSCEAAELPAGSDARTRHLVSGLCDLFGAEFGMAFLSGPAERPDLPPAAPPVFVGFDPTGDAALRRYFANPDPPDPVIPHIHAAADPIVTLHRQAAVDDRAWYASAHYEHLRHPLRFDHGLYARLAVPGVAAPIGVGFYRATGRRAFEPHDADLLTFFHNEAWRLYLPAPDPAPPPAAHLLTTLPPRLRPVLDGLLLGDGAKQVARRTGLSHHTVREYIKALYRHLHVSTRGELMALFLSRPTICLPAQDSTGMR